ncbi:hypothetical protein [Aquimarina aquimarini]|uniref:hypothetical protein n=1 Tax=Aquimarina aquimarini TaxID=1191734 RepID=UPI001F43B8D8|nr:hypothetical protein [Aquimarina aquimarini]
MKTNFEILKFLFLFLFTLLLASCTSTEIGEEVSLEVKDKNELSKEIIKNKTYLIDKGTSERPGNQG